MSKKVVVFAAVFFVFLGAAFFLGPNVFFKTEVYQEMKSMSLIKFYGNKIDLYFMKYKKYPDNDVGLSGLVCEGEGEGEGEGGGGGYCVSRVKLDPWGRAIRYNSPGVHNVDGYDLWIEYEKNNGKRGVVGNWQ